MENFFKAIVLYWDNIDYLLMMGGIFLGIINKGNLFVFFMADGIVWDCIEDIIVGYC